MELNVTLENGFQVRSIPTDRFNELSTIHAEAIFSTEQYFFKPRNYYSDEDKQKLTELKANMGQPLRLNLGVFQGEDLVGWSWGVQESAEVFYMVNSAVLPEYRGRGLYFELTKTMLRVTSDLGFQVIYSRHVATNNAVLIPKLKAGFQISSFEISDQYGVLVHLRWYANPTRRKVFDFRAGGIGPDSEIKNMFK